ncbi:ABC transporter permease [Corynebacterium testudinoris]|uniref:ABC superfamily ATP binding cassette transporter, permease protein n=1 Tax=Corynebacterium testudinoris TaxID=136857 RepID=A0A0G3H8C7_9CORY|nr:FtsX-like permease family protein [Corynebacterium testudinoris]AKK09621.1 ABC superfamily ATP binding cassette transporter, permease protein [Corynebacterium testudinoris]
MASKNSTMRRVSLRNIASHKLRLALTVLAVVLGTAFISGAFMFTNSLSTTFKTAVSSAYEGVDAVVQPGEGMNGISAQLRDEIAQDPMVKNANAIASTTVVMARADETAIQTGGGTSSLSIWYPENERVGETLTMTDGEQPAGDNEIVLSKASAERYGINLGDSLLVVDPQARHEMTVSGFYTAELDQGTSLQAFMAQGAYLDRFTEDGTVNRVVLSAADGTSDTELVDHLTATYPDVTVETGQKLADDMSEAMTRALSFVNYFLVAFGLVALLVGTFLIANTFSMIVAQRTKEFALLRALGAARQQITRSVVFEAGVVGVVGSALGVVAGMGLVAVIKAIMSSRGMPMPDSGLGLSMSSVAVPVVLGTIVTIISAWMPARRAGSIRPVEAMRSTEASSDQSLTARTIVGVVLILLGAVAALAGVLLGDSSTSTRAILVGIGAFGVIVGFFFAGPAFSLPIVPTLGRVIGVPFGAVGKLASTKSRRNPRRTATTAFALTLGVALVTAIGMLGDTMKTSISDVVENNVTADYVLQGPTNGSFPVPAAVPDAVRDTAGVGEVVTMSMAPIKAGETGFSMGFGPQFQTFLLDGNLEDMAHAEMREGNVNLKDNPGIIATTDFADRQGWKVGDTLQLSSPDISANTVEAKVIGIFEPNNVISNMAISTDLAKEIVPQAAISVQMVGVNGDGSVDDAQLRTNLEEAVKGFIVMQVLSAQEMASQAGQSIDQMLNILYGLLALAVIIAILGIVNTLTLGVIERRQEIGMLRAVGSQRRQVRTMITLEAVQIAVFGAVMGVLIGLGLGWAFLKVLSDEGLDVISVPYNMVAWMLGGSAIVGIFAAVWPANRAAKTPPLDAISD